MRINEIAHELGFTDESHLNGIFQGEQGPQSKGLPGIVDVLTFVNFFFCPLSMSRVSSQVQFCIVNILNPLKLRR